MCRHSQNNYTAIQQCNHVITKRCSKNDFAGSLLQSSNITTIVRHFSEVLLLLIMPSARHQLVPVYSQFTQC